LFQLKYDLLLYDVTSTYFEGEALANPLAQRGYSRDGRPDCKQETGDSHLFATVEIGGCPRFSSPVFRLSRPTASSLRTRCRQCSYLSSAVQYHPRRMSRPASHRCCTARSSIPEPYVPCRFDQCNRSSHIRLRESCRRSRLLGRWLAAAGRGFTPP